MIPSPFSTTAIFSAFMSKLRAFGASFGIAADPIVADLSAQDLKRNREALAPLATQLEAARQSIIATLDRRALIVLPLAALVAPVLFLASGGFAALLYIPQLLLVAMICVTTAWLILQYPSYKAYKDTTRQVFGQLITSRLAGFDYKANPVISLAKLRAWPLFPHVSAVDGWDMMKGRYESYDVTLCRLNINYHYRRQQRRESHRNSRLHAQCIRIEAGLLGDTTAVLLPDMVDIKIHRAITGKHGLVGQNLNDPDLDQYFRVFSSSEVIAERLTPALREQLCALGRRGDPPLLVIMPDQTIALFPLPSDVFVPFTPRPYWESVDADQILLQFASDLSKIMGRLSAVVALHAAAVSGRPASPENPHGDAV